MKFTAAAILAAVGFADAKKLVNKKALLRAAVPVDKNGNRRLQDQEFEITGEYSIKFNHCLSLKIAADNYEDVLFDGNVIEYTKEGKVLAQTSYVLFNVCQTQNCYYDDDETLYMVDLPTYMGAVVESEQQKEENYCQACEDTYETCYPNQNEQQDGNQDNQNQDGQDDNQDNQNQDEQQQDENQDNQDGDQQDENQDNQNQDGDQQDENQDNGERRLQDQQGQGNQQGQANEQGQEIVYYDNVGYIVVDCDTCEAKGCWEEDQQYDENNANWQITDEVIDEWIQNMLECVDTEVVGPTGEDNLYAGFICNADGSGVEPAIFLDNGCAVYTSMYAYGNVVSGTNNYDIMYQASDAVTAPFLNAMSCENIQYLSIEGNEELAYQAAQQAYDQAENGDNNQQQEEQEADELCQQLMQNAVDLKTCGGYEEEYQEDEDEDVYEEGDEDYSWYTYLVADDAADDAQGTCVVVAALEGEFSSAHTYTEDDGEGGGSGHVYDYKSSRSFGGEMNAGKIFGIIIAVIVVIVAAVLVMQSMGGKKDTKKVPLVNNKSGAMA